mgnify:CR=1 FL=1
MNLNGAPYNIFSKGIFTGWIFAICIFSSNIFAQDANFKFETAISPECDYVLYYSEQKLNKFKTIYTSIFEINSETAMISHRKGNNLRSKKPWLAANIKLVQKELDAILGINYLKRLPENHTKFYKSLRNKPVITLYFKTPFNNIFIQWEGPNPPNKRVVVRLLKFYNLLSDFIMKKLQENHI